jgi:hypothetical protein
MAEHSSNGAASLLELQPRPARSLPRKAPTVLSPVAEVHETPTDIVVRVRLQQGALELSIPKRALRDTRPELKSVVPGGNPDASPC